MFMNRVVLSGNSAQTLVLSVTAAQTDVFPAGNVAVWSDVDCYVKSGKVANDVTVANGYLIKASQEPVFLRLNHNERIGGIAAGAGNLKIHPVD